MSMSKSETVGFEVLDEPYIINEAAKGSYIQKMKMAVYQRVINAKIASRRVRKGNMNLLVAISLSLMVFGVVLFVGPYVIVKMGETTNNTIILNLMNEIVGMYSFLADLGYIVIIASVGGAIIYIVLNTFGKGKGKGGY